MTDATSVDRSRPPAPGPVRPFRFPHVERTALPNGLNVLAARHGQLPLVAAALVVEGGASGEPAASAGLAHLVARALDSGTRDRSADQLAWALERLGVEFHAEARWDGAILGIMAPRERLEAALDIFAEIARSPAFRPEEADRLRDEQIADILQRQKDPRALASDSAARLIYAPGVPYGRPLIGTRRSVAGLTAADARAFFERWYGPGGGALLLVGDIQAGEARALAESRFGDWAGTPPSPASLGVSPRVDQATIFVVDRPDSVQSEIRVGDVGVERGHPDYFALLVMNSLLGGAFTSRLNMNLREKHGFTYGVHSRFAFRRRPGPFMIQTAVATDVTARALEEILREVGRLRQAGAPLDEVAAARDYLAGTQPLELQTSQQLAGWLTDLVIHDLPDDYFDTYRERIMAVTPEDVQRVAREHIRPDRFATVIVGNAAGVVEELKALGAGPVEIVAAVEEDG